ncbi:hypothetical protein XENOCAPTIV_012692, partial [Xenoophorus captivus]
NQNPKFPSRPRETLVDLLLILDPEQKRLTSSIYSLINRAIDALGPDPKDSWELKLEIALPGDHWQQVLRIFNIIGLGKLEDAGVDGHLSAWTIDYLTDRT